MQALHLHLHLHLHMRGAWTWWAERFPPLLHVASNGVGQGEYRMDGTMRQQLEGLSCRWIVLDD